MKLCITATGKTTDSNIDARFGRASWLLIIDTDTGAIIEALENTASAQTQGAGITAAKVVSDKSVDAILTGSVGPNATSVFQTSGVRLFEGASPQDTVQEALAKFKQGSYGQQAQSGASATPSPGAGGKLGRGIAGGGRGMGGGAKGRGTAGGGRGMGGGGRGRGIAGGGRGMGGGGGKGMGGGSGQGGGSGRV